MAQIVLGIGTSHSPSLSMGSEWWTPHAEHFDPTLTGMGNYEERCAAAPDWLKREIDESVFARKHDAANTAIEALGKILRDAKPDMIVCVGDDQHEMFPKSQQPTLTVFAAESLVDLPSTLDELPPSIQAADWAIHGKETELWPGAPALGEHVTRALIRAEFDVFYLTEQPAGRTLGHAFTFVYRRLLQGGRIPMLPILLNTYYPPAQMRAARCWQLGLELREAIDAWQSDARVAIIGSGGLSHFFVDEPLDGGVLRALAHRDANHISAIAETDLQSGSSEIKNWIVAGAALDGFEMEVLDYVPAYRTRAATGIGLAFAVWRPKASQ
jgi:3-O-methylgallate 3,4-dioxygenase